MHQTEPTTAVVGKKSAKMNATNKQHGNTSAREDNKVTRNTTAQRCAQTKSHPNTQGKHSSIGNFYSGQLTSRDTAQSVCCQMQRPVACCKNHRVCIPYNSCRVVCTDDLVEPSQLSQIKFMTIPPQNRPPNPKSLPVLESRTIRVCTISTSTGYQLPVT